MSYYIVLLLEAIAGMSNKNSMTESRRLLENSDMPGWSIAIMAIAIVTMSCYFIFLVYIVIIWGLGDFTQSNTSIDDVKVERPIVDLPPGINEKDSIEVV